MFEDIVKKKNDSYQEKLASTRRIVEVRGLISECISKVSDELNSIFNDIKLDISNNVLVVVKDYYLRIDYYEDSPHFVVEYSNQAGNNIKTRISFEFNWNNSTIEKTLNQSLRTFVSIAYDPLCEMKKQVK